MTRIRMIGLCLVAVFALSAVVASGASARTAERGACKVAKKGLGEYTEALCLTAGAKAGPKKEYVWVPQAGGTPTAFTSKTGVATLRSFTPEGAELPAVECKKSAGKGKEGKTESTSVVTFSECTSAGEKCTGGKKAKAGEIITFELKGTLGVISEAKSEVGEDLVGQGPGGLSSEFKCGANEIKTEGSVIGKVAKVNAKASATNELIFAATGKVQEPEKFEGEPADTLKTEINGLGFGTFPFASTEVTTATVKGKSAETRLF